MRPNRPHLPRSISPFQKGAHRRSFPIALYFTITIPCYRFQDTKYSYTRVCVGASQKFKTWISAIDFSYWMICGVLNTATISYVQTCINLNTAFALDELNWICLCIKPNVHRNNYLRPFSVLINLLSVYVCVFCCTNCFTGQCTTGTEVRTGVVPIICWVSFCCEKNQSSHLSFELVRLVIWSFTWP